MFRIKIGGIHLKICICDDNNDIHSTIKSLIVGCSLDNISYSLDDVYSAEELLKNYSTPNKYDIIFLDIEMNRLNGIEAAEKIRIIDSRVIIIFISSYPNYVFDAFKVEALHFIVKPISTDEFNSVFERALHKYNTLNSSLTLKWQGERFIINIDSIKYIEGYMLHITVYTADSEYESLGKIPEMLSRLSSYGFIQTHQGFLVNMNYIKSFEKSDIVLTDNTRIMLSVRKRANALQAFDRYIRERKW